MKNMIIKSMAAAIALTLVFTGCSITITPSEDYDTAGTRYADTVSEFVINDDNSGSSYRTAETGAANTNASPASDNTMTATINGTTYEMVLQSAKLGPGYIQAAYAAYNPRGEQIHYITMSLDSEISEGSYSSADGDTDFRVSSGVLYAHASSALMGYAGSYDMELTYRSDDWYTYAGEFSAELTPRSNASSSGLSIDYGLSETSMTIENASFRFTIEH